jgi:hypothetical protein
LEDEMAKPTAERRFLIAGRVNADESRAPHDESGARSANGQAGLSAGSLSQKTAMELVRHIAAAEKPIPGNHHQW